MIAGYEFNSYGYLPFGRGTDGDDAAFAFFLRDAMDEDEPLPAFDVRIQREKPAVSVDQKRLRDVAERLVVLHPAVNAHRYVKRQSLGPAVFYKRFHRGPPK
jgi:hypothetical protein